MTNHHNPGADSIAVGSPLRTWLRIGQGAADLWRHLRCWSERARQRRELARLTDDELADIGIRREDALAESGKPFWQT